MPVIEQIILLLLGVNLGMLTAQLIVNLPSKRK